jgi:hypothetical protein
MHCQAFHALPLKSFKNSSIISLAYFSPTIVWVWILALDPFSAFLWVILNLIYMCVSVLFCVKRCMFFFAVFGTNLLETFLMWLFHTYSYYSFNGVSSFPFEVKHSALGNWDTLFMVFVQGLGRILSKTYFLNTCVYNNIVFKLSSVDSLVHSKFCLCCTPSMLNR